MNKAAFYSDSNIFFDRNNSFVDKMVHLNVENKFSVFKLLFNLFPFYDFPQLTVVDFLNFLLTVISITILKVMSIPRSFHSLQALRK